MFMTESKNMDSISITPKLMLSTLCNQAYNCFVVIFGRKWHQAPIEVDLHMEIIQGITTKKVINEHYVL
ncbi:hypothetical protein ACHAXS_008633 [Conticribra weissflogii]